MFLTDEDYMQLAIDEAKLAFLDEEVPIGAVVVDESGSVISMSHNLRETKKSPSAHAEFLAIESACKKKKHGDLMDVAFLSHSNLA